MPPRSITNWRRHPGVIWLGIGAAAFLVIAGLRLVGALQAMELNAYDLFLKLRPTDGWREDRVVAILINDEDIRRVGQWPLTDDTLVAARAAGTTVLRATSEGRFGEATITVLSPGVATVTVSPSTTSVVVAATLTLTAQVRDASGGLVSSPGVTWTTSDSTVAAVSSAGVVTGVKAGSATITATSGEQGVDLLGELSEHGYTPDGLVAGGVR